MACCPSSTPGSSLRSWSWSTPRGAAMPDHLGVVVMAYGTPASTDDIEAYYTHIRRGRAPTPEQLAEQTARSTAIGGTPPPAQRTEGTRPRTRRQPQAHP